MTEGSRPGPSGVGACWTEDCDGARGRVVCRLVEALTKAPVAHDLVESVGVEAKADLPPFLRAEIAEIAARDAKEWDMYDGKERC